MNFYKDIILDVDVNTCKRDCIQTGQEFCSYDKKAARLVIKLTKDCKPILAEHIKAIRLFIASSDAYGRVKDGFRLQEDINQFENGQACFVIPQEYLSYSGSVVVHIYVVFNDEVKNDAGQAFIIRFRRSAIDDSHGGNVIPNYLASFDDILENVKSVADEKMAAIESLGIDIGDYVKDYLSESPDIATKDYVNAKADVSDNVLMAWLFLESEGE